MREMKNSGIEWIGDIPSEWDTSRLQWLVYEIKESNNPIKTTQVLSLTNKLGVVPYEDKGNQGNKAKEDYSQYGLAFENTLVINSMNVLIGSVGISKYFGCVSPVYYVFRNTENSDLRYINYIFQNVGFQKELRKYANGILEIRLRISAHDMLRRIVPCPSLCEQIKIADFLDEKCAEIDTVIEKTKATIEEYKKLKQSVITQAVTKGIRPNRPMKDSGIEWIGEIPAEWNMVKITRLLDYNVSYPIGDGDHGLISPSDYLDVGVPYLRVQNLGFGTPINDNGLVYISEETNKKIKGSILRPNDVLFAKTGATIGKTGIIPSNMPIANTTSHIGKITVSPDYNPMWILYTLSSNVGYRQFWEIAIQKTTRPELSIAEIKSIRLPMPKSSLEQEFIVNYLDKKCSEIDELIAKKTSLLSELESYKKSLIYEYVTGKKEVK